MHIHVLGICGTFMSALALIARDLGHRVTGSDRAAYPPIGPMLQAQGIEVMPGYDPAHLDPRPDLVVVGNALSRGNPAVEYMLDARLPYTSGPQWLAQAVLEKRRVIAIAGTHGKTTTTSIVAWILEHAGVDPGFLIGGMPENFDRAGRLGGGEWFVIEADEYDTAFFDKRSKFLHYRPEILLVNNIEFDHADIFPDLAAIERQFQHLVRTVPGGGRIIRPKPDTVVDRMLAQGCWSTQETFGPDAGADWRYRTQGGGAFDIHRAGAAAGSVLWSMYGEHNTRNATAAIACAAAAGLEPAAACAALATFRAPRRRLERVAEVAGVCIYDDFAHHPTAIAATIAALRERVGGARIIAVFEPRSNSLKMGVQKEQLGPALAGADMCALFAPPELPWDLAAETAGLAARSVDRDLPSLVDRLAGAARPGDHVLVMSNGDFGGIHHRLADRLRARAGNA
ncbi:MAG: UDP-N-acetylmuramate:L-alanyl-gamma-D-glutamyl-meso-diaminopimelate ligase [Gammaproteobacteria bacterium]